jgi:hypothetical protein
MNGRVYDPLTAQFLSPDPYIQAPGNWLNYNRYSYCLNNPFKYTDPSGEVFGVDDALVILAMAYFGGMQANFMYCSNNGTNMFNPGNWNWKSGSTYLSIVSGAVSGVNAVGIGFSLYPQVSGMLTNGFLQAGIQVGVNGLINLTDKRPFFSGWYWSALQGFASGAYAGYNMAKASDKNVWFGQSIKVSDEISNATLSANAARYSADATTAGIYDEYLADRVKSEYGVGIGDYGITNITTKAPKDYGMTGDGIYVNLEKRTLANGVTMRSRNAGTRTSSVHISPYITFSGKTDFRATTGHELIHAYHWFTINNYVTKYSEMIAYRYTVNEYMNNSDFMSAFAYKRLAYSMGYNWNLLPSWNYYLIPF